MRPTGDLTTAESWDELWRQSSGVAGISPVKRKLRQTRIWNRLLERLLDAPGDGVRDVLELGCAPGLMLANLYSLRPQHRYSGIDYAPAGLDVARATLAARGISADLHAGDIRSACVPPADLVMSFGLVEHFDDPVEVMSCHRRFVRPGGMTAVTVPNYAHPLVVRLLRRFSPDTLATHRLEIMNPAALSAALTGAGFVDVRAGYSGGPVLPSSRARRDLPGRCYGFFARAWNVATGVLPERWPWAANVWATGRNP